MKKILSATAIGGALFAGSLSLAPTASAMTKDEADFVSVVEGSLGITSSKGDSGILSIGYSICDWLKAGYSGPTIASALASDGTNVSYKDAHSEIVFAVGDLCMEQVLKLPNGTNW